MLVKDVMTTGVAVVAPAAPIDDALHLLVSRSITSLPVVDDDRAVVGIVSEADLLGHLLSRDPRAHHIPVRPTVEDPPRLVSDVMTRAPHVTRPDEDVSHLAALMVRHGWKSVPVVADGRLAGVLSRSDVLRALTQPDEWIQRQVQSVLRELGHSTWQVSVTEGLVTLSGPGDPQERSAAEATALSVSGVRRVHVVDRR